MPPAEAAAQAPGNPRAAQLQQTASHAAQVRVADIMEAEPLPQISEVQETVNSWNLSSKDWFRKTCRPFTCSFSMSSAPPKATNNAAEAYWTDYERALLDS